MKTFIPYEKLSKKAQRKLNAAKRSTWDMNPVTRRPENPKAYNRKKTHHEFDDYSFDVSSAYFRPVSSFLFLCSGTKR